MKAGSVKTLLILGGNPVLTAPASLDFPNLLAGVPETLHLTLFADETGKVTHWQVPAAHYLESWGDTRSLDGTVSPVQPESVLPPDPRRTGSWRSALRGAGIERERPGSLVRGAVILIPLSERGRETGALLVGALLS